MPSIKVEYVKSATVQMVRKEPIIELPQELNTSPLDQRELAVIAMSKPHQCCGVLHEPNNNQSLQNHPAGVYIQKNGNTFWAPCPLWVEYMRLCGNTVRAEIEEKPKFKVAAKKLNRLPKKRESTW